MSLTTRIRRPSALALEVERLRRQLDDDVDVMPDVRLRAKAQLALAKLIAGVVGGLIGVVAFMLGVLIVLLGLRLVLADRSALGVFLTFFLPTLPAGGTFWAINCAWLLAQRRLLRRVLRKAQAPAVLASVAGSLPVAVSSSDVERR